MVLPEKIHLIQGKNYMVCAWTGANLESAYGVPNPRDRSKREGYFADPACAVAFLLSSKESGVLAEEKVTKYCKEIERDLKLRDGQALTAAPYVDPTNLDFTYRDSMTHMLCPQNHRYIFQEMHRKNDERQRKKKSAPQHKVYVFDDKGNITEERDLIEGGIDEAFTLFLNAPEKVRKHAYVSYVSNKKVGQAFLFSCVNSHPDQETIKPVEELTGMIVAERALLITSKPIKTLKAKIDDADMTPDEDDSAKKKRKKNDPKKEIVIDDSIYKHSFDVNGAASKKVKK